MIGWISGALLFLLFVLLPLIAARYLVYQFCRPGKYSYQESVNWGMDHKYYSEDPRDSYPWEEFTFQSRDGLKLYGVQYIKNPEKIVILVHGHRCNWLSMMKYAPSLLEQDWSIVAFDHRYYGKSQGKTGTGGIKEKEDLYILSRRIREDYPHACIGLWGESMGGAITLQVQELNPPVDFSVAICPYTELPELFHHHFHKSGLRGIFKHLAYFWANLFFSHLTGGKIQDISAIESLNSLSIPLLLIHGEEDDYVPTQMSRNLHDHYPHNTELLLIPGGTHAQSSQQNPEVFWKGVFNFLQKNGHSTNGR